MSNVLVAPLELESAQETLKSNIQAISHEIVRTTIGYQSGHSEKEVVWLPTLGIWAHLGFVPSGKSEGTRFWNAFGIGRPGKLVSIICEINPSRKGINRQTNGAFVVDEKGQLLICHRGKFTIAGGMTGEFFRSHYRGTWIEANEGSHLSNFIRVTQLDSRELGESLRNFVLQVDQIKKLARSD